MINAASFARFGLLRSLAVIVTVLVAMGVLVSTASTQNPSPVVAVDTQPAMANPKTTDASSKLATSELASDTALSNLPDLITAGTYAFTSSSAVALEDMSSGTTQLVAANLDDTASGVNNIGFEFWFDGVRFTQFSCNANGLCRLGNAGISISFDNSTEFNSTTNAPKIAPYFDDLWTGTNGKVHFKVIGSAPNRKLIVEWLNEQIPRVGGGNAGAGTFQMWLFETTGVIEFVYGSGIALNSDNGGYSIGLQSGAATNFASVTSTGPTISYAAANNTQTNAITSGTKYTLTPNVPAAPTGLSFTAIAPVSMTLNWTDNATNEFGYVIYNSTDGINFSFVTQTAANATSQNVTGLTPSTNYFWQVYAVTEGAVSSVLAGSQMTSAPGAVSSTASGGNWSSPATWVGGNVPTAGDNVTITNGAIVTIDTSAVALNLTVGQGSSGILQFEPTTARTLTTGQSVTINSGAVLQSASTGTVTTHVLSVGGNLVNNGVLDFSTNANTAGAGITFTGAANAAFSGSGPTTDIRTIIVNKGTSSASVLELMPTNLTVRGVTTDVAGFLTLTNGTFKISGSFTVTSRVFTTVIYTIPSTCGIWLNNPNFAVAGTASSTATTNNGLFRVSQGTYNIGVGAGDEMGGGPGAVFIIEGGTINASGRLDPQSAVSYTQTGGTVNVATVGNTRSLFGSFEIFNTAASFTMSGGTINVINRNTGATQVDYDVLATTTNVTGGLLVIGATGAPAATTYHVQGTTPNLTINPTMSMIVTTNASSTFPLFMRGSSVINNGSISSAASGSPRFDFAATSPMTYTGGTFGTLAAPFAGVGISSNSTSLVTLNSPIFCNRVNLFQGGFINSNQITLGNGAASTTVVQIGSTGLTTPGGNFDVSPVHNQGTGGEIVLYAFETAPRTTSFEINPTRTLTSISVVDNPNNVTIAGGDVTLTSTAAAINFTNGRLITGSNTLILSSGTAVVTRTNGYVDGNFRKNYAASTSKAFEVGTANGFSPVTVNVTGGTPADVTVKAVQGPQPNIFSPALALQRYWRLTALSAVTADLTLQYLASDVAGDETLYQVLKYDGAFSTPVGSSVDMVNHRGLAPGQANFTADWTVGQPNAPTAAPARLAGQITTRDGRPLGGVTVNLYGHQARRTITDGNGNYHFDNVETDNFYTVTPALTNFSFSPANRSFSLLGSNIDATFTAVPDPQTGNPLVGGDFFVRQQYLDFLGREPDNDGWLYWTAQISACGANQDCVRQRRIDVSAAFFNSEEFQQTGAFIHRLYKTGVGRQLTYAEFSSDLSAVLSTSDLDSNKDAFTESFVRRPEFLRRFENAITGEGFVDAMIASTWQATGVDLTSRRDLLLATFAAGGDSSHSRGRVLRAIVDTSAVRDAEYNPGFVLMEYFGYLHRDPDAGGYAFWLDVLNNHETGNYRGMVCAFITSAEYQQRFSSVVVNSTRDCGR
ncbi:MAG TPA: fibronectin type III domain-containing protein [Pyrinomonadaceae bacterium]